MMESHESVELKKRLKGQFDFFIAVLESLNLPVEPVEEDSPNYHYRRGFVAGVKQCRDWLEAKEDDAEQEEERLLQSGESEPVHDLSVGFFRNNRFQFYDQLANYLTSLFNYNPDRWDGSMVELYRYGKLQNRIRVSGIYVDRVGKHIIATGKSRDDFLGRVELSQWIADVRLYPVDNFVQIIQFVDGSVIISFSGGYSWKIIQDANDKSEESREQKERSQSSRKEEFLNDFMESCEKEEESKSAITETESNVGFHLQTNVEFHVQVVTFLKRIFENDSGRWIGAYVEYPSNLNLLVKKGVYRIFVGSSLGGISQIVIEGDGFGFINTVDSLRTKTVGDYVQVLYWSEGNVILTFSDGFYCKIIPKSDTKVCKARRTSIAREGRYVGYYNDGNVMSNQPVWDVVHYYLQQYKGGIIQERKGSGSDGTYRQSIINGVSWIDYDSAGDPFLVVEGQSGRFEKLIGHIKIFDRGDGFIRVMRRVRNWTVLEFIDGARWFFTSVEYRKKLGKKFY